MTDASDIGVVGLGVMGRSLALNITDHGFSVAVMDLDPAPGEALAEARATIRAVKDAAALAAGLTRPRRILLMVPAGGPVDASLEGLAPYLEEGDVVIDGGNEHFERTESRQTHWRERGILLLGMGVSGGEAGARRGPSLMPGGAEAAYRAVEPVLRAVAAQVEDGPCVTYVGPGGAGHFVKMVHNGIEYADMQLIAEVYDLLGRVGGLDHDAMAEVFEAWDAAELESFLVEITARILRVPDDRGEGRLVDAILDTAKMKGTGSWTVRAGADLAAPIPTISAAVEARLMSGLHPLRQRMAERLTGPQPTAGEDREAVVADARAALYAARIAAYAQGLDLLREAGEQHRWDLDLAEIARIWKAGCIIRARLLGRIQSAYGEGPLRHLLLDPALAEALGAREAAWRRTVARCVRHGIAVPALGSALAYYDGLRSRRLPANLTQAQRDLFGAHRFQRRDADGDFHADW